MKGYEEVDVEKLREDLIDYFGSASPIPGYNYNAVMGTVDQVEQASDDEVIRIALVNHFNLHNYQKTNFGIKK